MELITLKHDDSIMVWECFSFAGTGSIHLIDGTMNAAKYIRIFSQYMLPSARRLIGSDFIFQQDNDPKHTAKATKNFMNSKNIRVLE